MIQFVSLAIKDDDTPDFKYSTFESPDSFDNYEINIIDLSDDEVWTSSYGDAFIGCFLDLQHIAKIIENSTNGKHLILLPQNITCTLDPVACTPIPFKNILEDISTNIFSMIFGINYIELLFENTQTIINGKEIKSCFYFNEFYRDVHGEPSPYEIIPITFSKNGNKATTIQKKSIDKNKSVLSFTTLDLASPERLLSFLDHIKYTSEEMSLPQWLLNIDMFDDKEQKSIIKESEAVIEIEKKKISECHSLLEKNERWKSILSSNGDYLIEVVLEILEQLLDCELASFIDKKKEDFIAKKDNITFIGEIKGVTSNVRNEHISQLEVHCQTYMGTLIDKNRSEDVKAILIINKQRTTPINERKVIHKSQIELAQRNNSLIIETNILLKYFEKYLNKEITSPDFISIIKNQSGNLEVL